MFPLIDKIASLPLEPEVITIGEARKLSRRKAKKLANLYRGSRRGKWYKQYLDEDTQSFLVVNNRLVRFPKFVTPVWQTFHSADVVDGLKKMYGITSAITIESPADEIAQRRCSSSIAR